jgi:hypothetical protein
MMSAVDGGSTASDIQLARGAGRAIPDVDREPMERSFGADFSGVRIHTDSRADALNQSLGARALTSGKDVFFKRGEYTPGNKSGQKLLAHELTHVVQQNGGPGLNSSRAGSPLIQCKLIPIGHRAINKAIEAGAPMTYDEAKEAIDQSSTLMPEALQEDACRFAGERPTAQDRLDYVRAKLLQLYYLKFKYEVGEPPKGRGSSEREGRRVAENAVSGLKDYVAPLGLQNSVTWITPEIRARLEGKAVITSRMALRGGPMVEVAATKIPPQPGREASGGNFHSYIRYSTADGDIKYVRAHGLIEEEGQPAKLMAIYGDYTEGVHEYDHRGVSKIILEGDAAAGQWGALTAAAEALNNLRLNYHLTGPNCNTGARYILKKAGLGSHSPPNAGTFFGWYVNTGHARRERQRRR